LSASATSGRPVFSYTSAAAGSRPASAVAPDPAARSLPSGRAVRFNGRSLDPAGLDVLARLERAVGTLADGDYWYDPRSGASGRWGGPALAFLPAGLPLGGPLPAEASGGGRGALTGVFVNGRELHPVDVAGLQELVGVVVPGRWWVDAAGNYAMAGDDARALDWLEKAYADRDPNMPFVGCNPIFDRLRAEPRFKALLRRMNLPQ
jgi:hypothetical protein